MKICSDLPKVLVVQVPFCVRGKGDRIGSPNRARRLNNSNVVVKVVSKEMKPQKKKFKKKKDLMWSPELIKKKKNLLEKACSMCETFGLWY